MTFFSKEANWSNANWFIFFSFLVINTDIWTFLDPRCFFFWGGGGGVINNYTHGHRILQGGRGDNSRYGVVTFPRILRGRGNYTQYPPFNQARGPCPPLVARLTPIEN